MTVRTRYAAALAAGITGAALLAPLTPAPPAAAAGTTAGSIVYIKDYNVWIARGDGTGARPVTTDGYDALPYENPSQSDTGLVVTSRYASILTFDQQGRKLAEIDPPALPGSGGHALDGKPVAVSVSPNAQLIAYSFAEYCGPGCGYRTATGYTSSTAATDPAPRGTSFLNNPTWVGNNRTLQSGGFGSEVMVHNLGSSTQTHWFDTDADFGNVDVSPDGKLIAGGADERDIDTYYVNGDVTTQNPPAPPTPGCHLSDGPPTNVKLSNPTWGPDSRTLAFQQPDGVYTFDHGQTGSCDGAITLIIPGASEPDWSTAQLSAPTMNSVTIPEISGSATVGGTLTASTGTWTAPPTSLTYQWFREESAIAGASNASYVVTAADAGKRLAVQVSAGRPGWPTGTSKSHAVAVPAAAGGGKPGGGGAPGDTSNDLRNTRKPAITGKPRVGRMVKATPGAWSPTPSRLTYQWLRDGRAIKRAKTPKYRIVRSDRRHRISVRVTAVRGGDRATAVSKAITIRR